MSSEQSDVDFDPVLNEDSCSGDDSSSDWEAERLKKIEEYELANERTWKLRKHNLRLTKGYCPEWGPKEGLREIVQNFLDGICSTFGTSMDEVEFHHTVKGGKEKTQWTEIWLATPKGSGEEGKEFGRITHNRKTRSITVTNANVTLRESVLLTGASSKRNSPNQIGGHGEGMKVGILRLIVAGSGVRYRTGGENWKFSMKKERGSFLETLHYETAKSRAARRKDLDVFITKIRSKHFVLNNFLPLSRKTQTPVAISKCADGQLIDSSIQDLASKRVFVKGMFVWEDTDLRVSVNLTCARLNRDREIMIADVTYKRAIGNIWTQTMKNEAGADDKPFTRKFLSIALHDKHSMEFQALEYMGVDAATHLYAQIKTENPEAFLFKEGAEEEEKLISSSLQKKPYPVSESLLKLLMKLPDVMTVYAAQEKAFLADTAKSPPHVSELPLAQMITAFVSKTCRDSSVQIRVEFHKSSGSNIQTLLNDGTLFCSETLVDAHFENDDEVLPYKVKIIAKVEQELRKGMEESEARRINYEMMMFIASAEFRNILCAQQEESEPPLASHLTTKEASEGNLMEGMSFSKDHNPNPCANMIGFKRRSEDEEQRTKRTRLSIEQQNGRSMHSTDRLDGDKEMPVEEDQSGDRNPAGREIKEGDAEKNAEQQGTTGAASVLNAGEPGKVQAPITKTGRPRSVPISEQTPSPAFMVQNRNTFSQRETPNSLPHSMQFALDDGTFEITHSMYPSTESQFSVRHDLGTSAMNSAFLAEVNLGSIFPVCKTDDSYLVLSVRRRRSTIAETDSVIKKLSS